MIWFCNSTNKLLISLTSDLPKVTTRYPTKDYDDNPLLVDSVTAFCYPSGKVPVGMYFICFVIDCLVCLVCVCLSFCWFGVDIREEKVGHILCSFVCCLVLKLFSNWGLYVLS